MKEKRVHRVLRIRIRISEVRRLTPVSATLVRLEKTGVAENAHRVKSGKLLQEVDTRYAQTVVLIQNLCRQVLVHVQTVLLVIINPPLDQGCVCHVHKANMLLPQAYQDVLIVIRANIPILPVRQYALFAKLVNTVR